MPPEALQDQATGLRQLLGGGAGTRIVGVFGSDPTLNAQAVANLALAMAQRGSTPWIFDETPGADLPTRFGLAPGRGLRQVVNGSAAIDEALGFTRSGVGILSCANGARDFARLDGEHHARLGARFAAAPPDWLFLAAPPDDRPSLAYAAPLRVLVVPGSKNRLTEAYALLKSVQRRLPDGRWAVLVMNLADTDHAALMMQAITETSRRFLEVLPGFLGGVPRDDKMEAASRALRPVLEFAPQSPAAVALRAAAETLAHDAPVLHDMDIEAFWQRLGPLARALGADPSTKATDGTSVGRYG
jgi:flagellar biosynthesis protein FlhG